MSTQINLTIGDQRLLQGNKTRAAANQQALDARTANKQLGQEATASAKTAVPERPPGAVPETNIPRRPAAQRRKGAPVEDTGYGLISAAPDNIFTTNPFSGNAEQEEGQQYSASWSAPYWFALYGPPTTYGNAYVSVTNDLTTINTTFQAGSYTLYGYKDTEGNFNIPSALWTEVISTSDGIVSNNGWIYKYKTTLPVASLGYPVLTGTPPQPPISQYSRVSGLPVKLASISVLGLYIYHSTYYMTTVFNFVDKAPTPTGYRPGIGTVVGDVQTSTFDSSVVRGNSKLYGVYRRTNIKTFETDTRTEVLREWYPSGVVTIPYNDYTLNTAYLLDRLYPDDPLYIKWKQTNDVTAAVTFKNNYTYDPSTGIRVIKRLNNNNVLEIYSNDIGKNLSYTEIPALPANWWETADFLKIDAITNPTIVADTAVVPYLFAP